MKKVIYKYTLEIADLQEIRMPQGARVLSAKEQYGKLVIWALCDTSQPERNKNIQIIGTGNPIEYNVSEHDWHFVDTVLMSNGLVWHVFADNH